MSDSVRKNILIEKFGSLGRNTIGEFKMEVFKKP